MPNRRSTAFVETVSSQIIGFKATARNEMTPQTASASFSLCRIAMRFGTSSPSTSVKNERISVITMTATVLMAPVYAAGMLKVSTKKSESRSAKLSAANAEPRKPASVMPIWIVERKRVGSSIIRSIFTAFLSPSSARALIRFSLSEITAISVAAKKAFKRIRTSCKSN